MIKSIKVTNYLGEELLLELFFPEHSGFIVTNIDGLGPGASTINTSPYASKDGSKYNSSRSEQRNIVLSLLFLPRQGETIEDKRHETYRYFPKKKKITLEITTDTRTAVIEGYVETNDPPIFSDNCGTSISIICPDPFFYSTDETVTHFYGDEPLFEFPFEDPIELTPSLLFSEYNLTPQKIITYDGDSDIGLVFDIFLLGRVGNLTLYNVTAGTSIIIDVSKIETALGSQLRYGDRIVLDTRVGVKNIYAVRDGIEMDVLSAIDIFNIQWFELTHGDNRFAITSESHPEFVHMTVYNKTSYEGV